MDLGGKVVAVTGGARGIGLATARAFAAAGAKVAIGDVDVAAAREAAEGFHGFAAGLDVRDRGSFESFLKAVDAELGPVDVLVNNAAIFTGLTHKPFTDIPDEEFDQVFAVNVRGVFACTRAVVPGMREAGRGSIINIASTVVAGGTPNMAHYVSSKSAVIGLTRATARELGEFRIRVNAVSPGLVSSEAMLDNTEHAGLRPFATARRSIKREQMPDDLVGPVLFLASDDSSFVTGQTLVADGGAYMP
jgi:NAD(P)-dependent dehydrogenase (short-subunit alcohol dehydrogenase family)